MDKLDSLSYYHYCSKSNLHKILNTLRGILSGVSMDGVINDKEVSEIRSWVHEQRRYQKNHPFSELVPLIDEALEDGVLDHEEIADINWFLDKATSENEFYDLATSDLQVLQGISHGILADGVVNEKEVKMLSDWLDESEHLKGCYPYDEIYALLMDVLADGKVDEQEVEMLRAYFSEFVSLSFGNQMTISRELKVSVTSLGVCSVDPEVKLKEKNFCFTGQSYKATRSQFRDIVEEGQGNFLNGPNQHLDYLIYGAFGNQCWAYSCYGRKVEKVVQMRKEGSKALIVHENDFWDAVLDAGLSVP